ncbi:MAG: hypothetical protein LBT12_04270, partial [Oscillospiraceae bacterium]|nr:hypothetical protein [Oscillospiraceae bacterium]
STLAKQYRKALSHDGLYAEAMLIADDEPMAEATDDSDENQINMGNTKRKQFIFCEAGGKRALFDEIDKRTAVPLIPDFAEYVIRELTERGLLTELKVLSASATFDAWLLRLSQDEREMIDIVNGGLSSGQLTIPGGGSGLGVGFNDVQSVTQYLNRFGVVVANRIKESFSPLLDPAEEEICDELKRINGYIFKKTGYTLFPAQLAVAEGVKRRLDTEKVAMVVAECGSGKTKIGAAALTAHQGKKSFNVVLCPSHITKKWVRELSETVPNSFAAVVHSITDVDKLYDAYKRGGKSAYLVLSKERARDGYMKQPAVRWSKSRRGFVCPDCDAVQEMRLTEDGVSYMIPADQFYYMNENDKNHKCKHCGAVLWQALNPSNLDPARNEWVKIGDYGFVHRVNANRHLSRCRDKKALAQIQKVADDPNGVFPTVGAYRRFAVSTYLKKKLKRVDGLILDELHLYKGDSGQGAAMAELIGISKKVIGMTATLISGYSSGIFYLLYRMSPQLMLMDGKEYRNPKPFSEEYGVVESVYSVDGAEYNATNRSQRRKLRERQLPGVSPLVYSRFLMDSAAFLSLGDMGSRLPDYEEIPIKLEMNPKVKAEYDRISLAFRKILQNDRKIAQKLLSQYLGLMTAYSDQPYGHSPVLYPSLKGKPKDDDNPIVLLTPGDTSTFDELHEKDMAVLDIVERKAALGERVLIYTSWVRLDTQDKLSKLLREKGYKADVLTVKVAPDKREDWVQKRVDNGVQALIANPALLETGLDLNAFTTLVYYNVGYSLFTFRQSSRRSWRINQTAPKIEVYILYYEGTMQARAIRLMASKLAVATIIEGNISDEGLAAMSECKDMTTLLARELTLGIRDEVEDIAETFKKMAIIKTDAAEDTDSAKNMILPLEPSPQPPAPISMLDVRKKVRKTIDFAAEASVTKKRRKVYVDPNQMTLYDLLAG